MNTEFNADLLSELRDYLQVVFDKGETISFDILVGLFVSFDVEWDEEMLFNYCCQIKDGGSYTPKFWGELL